ncbi:2Fe-2S iron-sulfur cluster-binding protein [Streptomyces sp. NBC_00102]|uniref:2Fe-2S iron-sulfur cluster-binding protein n=1 Tax=Streptomyces sp. NBC_00102 TaxID=2975652 RepID=UPI002256DEE8|nr:2Fe-2S iron-sulfur cluster-binding protein [Streptomyces sp. NBC_00102]MCX5398325.1 2Fe-2S iron-sulfur cluster-binding protein [Streptomyces sp. NBC_00102]
MFHPLRVGAVERITDDAVAVTFEVPAALRETFRHVPGQHLNVRYAVDGKEIRRSYSLCSAAAEPPDPPVLRVGIRLVDGGAFSTYALKELAVGDRVEAMAPTGRFTLEPRPGLFAAVVAGSGITPVLSIAATLLAREPLARFCLVRGDRTVASTMFLDEVADLKDRYPDRFHLVTALSREEQAAGLPAGRLDQERLTALLPALLPVADVDGWFLCGPYGLVRGARAALRTLDVDRGRVHQEVFHVEDAATPPAGTTAAGTTAPDATVPGGAAGAEVPAEATLTATLHGRSGSWPVENGDSLLETVLRRRADAPYACKGGVCGTCRAFLVRGEVRMDRNYALEPDETEAGFVLACQSHPLTPEVAIDFDR